MISISKVDVMHTLPGQDLSVAREGDSDNQHHIRWRFLCYFLHGFLVVLHIVLLAVSKSNHPEHRITLPFDNGPFATGLSSALQAFYILYTALLVFVTQGLVLSTTFSRPKKLTQIHDICSAWNGLGAALATLWSQTKVSSSVLSIVLVTIYFGCISVLHVASSTIMQLQPFNVTVTRGVPAVATWVGPPFDSTSINWFSGVAQLLPFMQDLYGNATSGLANNTLYSIPTQSFVNATVNATTLNARCGLLTNLSVTVDLYSYPSFNVTIDMTGSAPVVIQAIQVPLSNEVFVATIDVVSQNYPGYIPYIVSTAMDVDNSIHGVSSFYVNGSYGSGQNISTTMYVVACSLSATTNTITLGHTGSGIQLQADIPEQSTSEDAWSTFSPGGDMTLGAMISNATWDTQIAAPVSPYCQPYMLPTIWSVLSSFDAYMNIALGTPVSSCDGGSLADYTGPPSFKLTKGQMERVFSRIAAQFIWLAGELGSAGGGFDRQTEDSQVRQYVLLGRLNINPLPVVAALCASVVLLVLAVWMLRDRKFQPSTISGAGVLEVMWLGSRFRWLRGHLRGMQNPSLERLRASSMFETVFWTPVNERANKERGEPYSVLPRDDQETQSGSPDSSKPVLGTLPENELHQRRKDVHIPDTSYRRWCYALHSVLVALHVALLALLVRHPEHSVVIPIKSNVRTIGLSALLQAIYTLYSALLVVITQRLALLRIVAMQRKLTTIHDVSGAWSGIGAAIHVLWQQRQVTSSISAVVTVLIYLASMLTLHISSPSVMQWQVFNGTLYSPLASKLALPSNAVNISQLGWLEVFPILRSFDVDAHLSTRGVSNNTIYDLPQVPSIGNFSEAYVNATTLDVQCGLLPNLTITSQDGIAYHVVNFSLNGIDNGGFLVMTLGKDMIYPVIPQTNCTACSQTLFYMITAGIDVDESVHDTVGVRLNWTYTPSGGTSQVSQTLTYFAACSVSARTAPATLNLWDYQLVSSMKQDAMPRSTSWPVWSSSDPSNFTVGVTTAFTNLVDKSTEVTAIVQGDPSSQVSYTIYTEINDYLMNMLGINGTSVIIADATQSSDNPSVMLSPSQLENAIGKTTAGLLWLSGQLGENVGGFQRTVGESLATKDVLQWRLNLNFIPIIFASAASLVALVLVPFIIGKQPSKERAPLVSGTSVLESLWLEAHSETIHARLDAVEQPRLKMLRAAGMFDVFLGDIGRSRFPPGDHSDMEDAEMISVSQLL